MTWVVYDSTMPSAPVLNATENSLALLLKACLVDGFGAKPAAGWTMPYSATGKAVFKPSVGGGYYRFNDSAARGGAGLRVAELKCYEAMTDVDSGTGLGAVGFILKSTTSDAIARPWVLIADELSFYLLVNSNTALDDNQSRYYQNLSFVGNFAPFVAGDAWCYGAALVRNDTSSQPSFQQGMWGVIATPTASGWSSVFARSFDGATAPSYGGNIGFGGSYIGNHTLKMRNSADWVLSKTYGITDSANLGFVRGFYPSLYASLGPGEEVALHAHTGQLISGPSGPNSLFCIKFAGAWDTNAAVFIDILENRAA